MENSIHTNKLTAAAEHLSTRTKGRTGYWAGLWEKAEFNRFGIISLLIVFVACTGGAAASFGAYDSTFQLAIVTFSSIICLVSVLAVTPMRVIIFSAAAALLIDGLVLLV